MKKFLIIICYLLTAIIVVPTFLILALQNLFFENSIMIKKILNDTNFYQQFYTVSSNDLELLITENMRDERSQMQTEQLQQIISLVDLQTLQTTIEKALDSLYSNLKNDEIVMQFDLIPIKQNILSGQPEEVTEIFNQTVPNTYTINFGQFGSEYPLIKSVFYLKYVGVAFLLLFTIIAFVLCKGWRQKFFSLSITSFIVGFLILLTYFILRYLCSENCFILNENSVSTTISLIVSNLITKSIEYIAREIISWGIVSLALGVIFIIVSKILPKPSPIISPTSDNI